MYRDGKGPNVKEIQRAMFNYFHCSPSYWKFWKGGVVAKEMVRGTAENGYSCLSAFFYMFETLKVSSRYCIMVNKDSHRFMCYFLAFGACIKGFAHMKKVIAVDGTHLHGKYESVLLSPVAQDTENHVYPIAFCVVDKENDASWTFFFEKLKEIVVDELDLSNTYSLEEFDNHFVEFKNKCPAIAVVLEYDIGFEKWRRSHFPGNRYVVMTTNIAESLNVMLIDEMEYPVASIFNSIAKRFGELFRERHAYMLKSMGNQMVPSAEKIARKKMIEGDSLYVENVTGDDNQSTVFDAGFSTYVDLLKKSCSCKEYELIKISCAHAMTVLQSKHDNEYCMSIYEYSSPLYKIEAYLLAYMHFINVVPLESEWCVPEELLNVKILPPLIDTKLGRKRRKRYKGISENFKSKRRNKCSICKRTGHNRTTCVNNNKSYTSLIELVFVIKLLLFCCQHFGKFSASYYHN
ncbi:hypothetical protein KY284_005166 [Solanum tuberosum]|nr:hypothetical protein KY284_005166 [Solanum tuberosum]